MHLIKLMIVDDEPLFREYIRTTMDFEAYGFTLCCEAKNGKEALELAMVHDPEVVLTDINMPLMDGLTFSEKLLEINPNISIVLISGHSEFEYAKRAVKIGVSDYILKPFEKEELMLTLLRLKDHIYKTLESEQSNVTQDTIKQSLCLSLINKEISFNPSLYEELNRLGIGIHSTNFLITTLSIDDIDQKWHDVEEKMLWRFAVKNVLNEILDEMYTYHSFYDYEGNIVSIIEMTSAIEELDVSFHKRLKSLINEYLGFGITLGIGTIHQGFEGIKESYDESITALNAKFLIGSNQAIDFRSLPKETKSFSFYNTATHEQCLYHLRRLDFENAHLTLTDLFNQTHQSMLDQGYTRMIYMSLISLVLSYLSQSGKNIDVVLGQDFSPYQLLSSKSTLEQWEQEVIHIFKKTIDYISTYEPSRASLVASKACDYIKTNYMNPELSVNDVATDQFINQTYLRTMFKEEMNLTVSDYITKIRLENAREMLKKKQYLLADIAEKVGYSDASYFSKSFKKFFGLSPSQFERSIL